MQKPRNKERKEKRSMDRNDMIVQEGNKSAAIFGIKSNFDM